jgi:hypothetical protein
MFIAVKNNENYNNLFFYLIYGSLLVAPGKQCIQPGT